MLYSLYPSVDLWILPCNIDTTFHRHTLRQQTVHVQIQHLHSLSTQPRCFRWWGRTQQSPLCVSAPPHSQYTATHCSRWWGRTQQSPHALPVCQHLHIPSTQPHCSRWWGRTQQSRLCVSAPPHSQYTATHRFRWWGRTQQSPHALCVCQQTPPVGPLLCTGGGLV